MDINKILNSIPSFLSKRDYLFGQLLLLLSLNLFVGLLFPLHFILKNTLYWDNFRLFSVFRENLHSLNYFGEIQWWSPRIQSGFPIYYFSFLGCNTTTPLFAVTAFVLWVIGQIGIYVYSFLPLYVIYFGFLVPLTFSIAVFSLARQIFDDKRVIFFIIIAASISPGVVFNLSDNGLEQTAYGIFFASAFLKFVRKPERPNFLLMSLSLLVLAVSFNHLFLYWNILFVPMFVILSFFFAKEPFRQRFGRIVKSVPLWHWVALLALFVVCLLPLFMTFIQGENIVRASIGGRVYDYEKLNHGNPLEVLSISTPGIGFEWNGGSFMPMNYMQVSTDEEFNNHLGYVYMGMVVLSFTIIGLIGGADPWRSRILIMLLLSVAVFILSGYSPIFSLILMLPTPLRAVSHYSDTLFRNGVFFLFMLASGLGFDALLKKPDVWTKRLIWIFLGTFLFSFSIFLAVYGRGALQAHVTGFFLVTAGSYFVVFFLFKNPSYKEIPKRLLILFLYLFLMDTSTFAYWHIRDVMWKNDKPVYEPSIKEIGATYNDMPSYSYTLLELKQTSELNRAGLDYSFFPRTKLYGSAYSPSIEEFKQTLSSGNLPDSLVLPGDYFNKDQFSDFFYRTASTAFGSSDIIRQSYNGYRLSTSSDRKALLFLRDSYFPGWKATVNGKNTEILKAFWSYKAVVIPEGKSEVRFAFSPGALPYTLLLSYIILLAVIVLWGLAVIKNRRGSGPPAI